MAESAVSFAAEHIDTLILEDSKALYDVESEAKNLHKELRKLEEFLDSVRNKEPRNIEQVRSSLADLGRIAYNAEDVVDTFVSETEGKVFRSLMPRGLFKSSRVQQASNKIQMLLEEMKEVKTKLKDQYDHERGEGSSNTPKKKLREAQVHGALAFQQAHLQADNEFVVGIDDDVNRLIKLLVGKLDEHAQSRSQASSEPVDVLAIVGMGGSGKTTIARNIYKHQKISKHFKKQAWVPLSKEWEWNSYHEKVLMSELLRQLGGSGTGNKLLGGVASTIISGHQNQPNDESTEVFKLTKSRLQYLLSNEKCLVVLDDVWHWEYFQKILHNLLISDEDESSSVFTTAGTKIVITTRQHLQLSADINLKWQCHYTRFLSDEDSWKLFNEMTKSNERELAKEHRGLAMEMLGTCKGLPLAIVALGRLLKLKDTIQEWERVFSRLDSEEGMHLYRPVNDILALSYDELPYYLKPCFLYLGLLAEDSTISAGSLKRMWIAEGFVKRQTKINETPEDAANRLLQELVEHTMVQVVTKTYAGKVKTLRVHDIMRDLCILKAHELDFLTIFASDADQGTGTHSSRRAAIDFSKCSKPLSADNSHLRSLLLFAQSSAGVGVGKHVSRVSQQGKLDLALVCEKFKLLRVLDIIGVKALDSTMPKEIGNLIHLRYLRVRSTNIRELPKSIGKLRKLLTLDYWDISAHNNEVIIPNVLSKLECLRHLFLPGDSTSNTLEDLKLDTLEELQTLWGVKGGNWILKEIKNLSSNLKKLCIQGISSLEQLEAVFNCPVIKTYDHLYALALDWYGQYSFSLELPLKALSSKENLKKLKLMGRAPDRSNPIKFPSSLGKIELHFTQLEEEETMDALGKLRNLKFLRLAKDSYIGSEWICKEDSFPALEELKLSNLPKLKIWDMKRRTMQCLKKMLISSCAGLERMPKEVKFISTIETLEIARMPTEFNSRFRKAKSWDSTSIGGEDFHIVQHIPNIRIRDSCAPLLF
ncbi:probable disease resistance protein At1g58602 [Chenopodium quinoa]|nr:probable disease resistance protein At1g58602 [Chenopodium quinoa]XP_021713702.1 probable disease resistance protein At1g58602 [Chenopodium quinoa]